MTPKEFLDQKNIVGYDSVRFTKRFPDDELVSLVDLLNEYKDTYKSFLSAYKIPLTPEVLIEIGFEKYLTDKSTCFKKGSCLITYVNKGRWSGKRFLKLGQNSYEDFCHIQNALDLWNAYFFSFGSKLFEFHQHPNLLK